MRTTNSIVDGLFYTVCFIVTSIVPSHMTSQNVRIAYNICVNRDIFDLTFEHNNGIKIQLQVV